MGLGLQITVEELEQKIILRLNGRLDAATSPILERKLNELHRNQLLLDFSDIDYLSSAGLRVLLSASKKARADQGVFVLFSLTEDVMDVVKMAGFEKFLSICSSEKTALQFSP